METACSRMHWAGLQNRALDFVNSGGPTGILEPTRAYNEFVFASLVPLFNDVIPNNEYQTLVRFTCLVPSTQFLTFLCHLQNARRQYILSVALEYNCVGLLRRCAQVWSDGSHLGRQVVDGLSLSTLTDWIWSRTSRIKESCNDLCIALFDWSGTKIDHRTQRTLSHCARQLKLLAELMQMIVTSCIDYIPSDGLFLKVVFYCVEIT